MICSGETLKKKDTTSKKSSNSKFLELNKAKNVDACKINHCHSKVHAASHKKNYEKTFSRTQH